MEDNTLRSRLSSLQETVRNLQAEIEEIENELKKEDAAKVASAKKYRAGERIGIGMSCWIWGQLRGKPVRGLLVARLPGGEWRFEGDGYMARVKEEEIFATKSSVKKQTWRL